MLPFIVRRVLQSLATILIASLVLHTFILVVLPDKVYHDFRQRQTQTGLGTGTELQTPEQSTWPNQYFVWLFDTNNTTALNADFVTVTKGISLTVGNLNIRGSGALTGDFGMSNVSGPGLSVTDLLASRWGNTLILVIAALIPTLLVAVPLGVLGAARHNSGLDHSITLASFAGLSLPPYWLGLMLILFFAVIAKALHDGGLAWMPYLPPGNVAAAGDEENIGSRLYHLILPASTLAIGQIAAISRHVRFAMLEVMKKDYVRTAWAKGVPMKRVLFRHAFRNAIIPVITTVAVTLPTLVSGTIVIETVFGYPGMGQLFFKAIGGGFGRAILVAGSMDYNVVLTLMLIMVIVVVLSNLLADMLYVVFNPRMKTG